MHTDILMITCNRPAYTRLSLSRLLESCDSSMRVWLWQNGTDPETVSVVRELSRHPRVHEYRHSPENVRLREPTNWFWRASDGDYLGKVDDDCLVPPGWADTLRRAHAAAPELGIACCWPFLEEDFIPHLAHPKIVAIAPGHQVLRNPWVNGSGYLMKRACQQQTGYIGEREAFYHFCIRASIAGWLHGWYYPFLYLVHMEDPRSPYSELRDEADFQRRPPLTAQMFGITSLAELRRRAHEAAVEVQAAHPDPRRYVGWRQKLRRVRERVSARGRKARFWP